ncbi:MOSC domain-containing protein [Brachybacterium sp. J144]|uniref:MOSC domain-containing protein n=1 Tax=unclassified Brachybacterium TaxID=2623841 RepID=UPI002E78CCFC|nr:MULTISPECIES: MOSC domain-containing protein [unclassified Brachybacterium]MEE1617269.1 MOSC domain-containing protein [Brachybacterium sp. J153]MEE1650991.1 MOSC domain-containing protein [Brachybacterium sp. J144]
MTAPAGRIAAVCTVAQLFPVPERGLMSGIDKRPVDGPIRLLTHGVLGDVQGDREHHGGIFKAVYAYSREVREQYAAERSQALPDGAFGENLVTAGQDTDGTVIGERWRIGSAEIEATCPRNPCGTFAAWMGDRRWGRRFTEGGHAGAYFRVLVEGETRAEDAIEVISRPEHGVSIADSFRGLSPQQARALLDWAQDTSTVLYDSLVGAAQNALIRADGDARFPDRLRSTGRGLGLGMGL